MRLLRCCCAAAGGAAAAAGNHVIQKCIERLPKGGAQFILDAIAGQEAALASHCYGCRIIQRLAEACDVEQIVSGYAAATTNSATRNFI